jgi:hypothetical protein
MRTLAAVLIAWESASGVHTWRGPSTWDRRIMAALIGWGYRASDIEASILPADSPDPDDDDSHEPTRWRSLCTTTISRIERIE